MRATVTIAGTEVNLVDLSLNSHPKSKQTAHFAFNNICKLQICRGIKTKKQEIMNKGKCLTWSKDGCVEKLVRSKCCKGFVPLNSIKAKICSSCNKLITVVSNSSVLNSSLHEDHMFAKSEVVSMKRRSENKENIPSKVVIIDEMEVIDVSETDSGDDDRDFDPDYSPHPQAETAEIEDIDGKVDSILSLFPALGSIENFKLLLKGQIMNSGKEDKRQNRWPDERLGCLCLIG